MIQRQIEYRTESRHHLPNRDIVGVQDNRPSCSVPLGDPTSDFEAGFSYTVSYNWGEKKLSYAPGCPCSGGL